ncbi:MAG: substrate-binding domain-containing protein [Campylobacteraceae bacterium]|jgi:phosphate transport system substrate-binding protein|nr:substrate-binding domain-containing protein [Campylobacteraceae bacterium]
MLKKIFTSVYMALFLCIPLLAHATGLLYMLILSIGIGGDSDWVEISETVICCVILLLPFIYLGYFWGKKFINKMDYAAYFAIFALAIYAFFCMNLAFVLSGWQYSSEIFNLIALFSNPLFLIINFVFAFSGTPIYTFIVQIIVYGGFGAGVALALWKKGLLKPDKHLKILIFVTLILALAAAVQCVYRNSMFLPLNTIKLQSFTEWSKYENYTPLRGEPTLKFEYNAAKIDGATALCPIFYSAYEALYPKIENKYDYLGCSTTPHAYENLIGGEAELIFAAAPSDEQLQNAADKGVKLTLTPIGKEAFVFLVNKNNPVNSLSVQNIRDIYSGKIKNWREFGGENEKILAFQRNENSGSQTAMQKYVMKDTPFTEPIKEEFYGSMGGMIEGVADYRNAKNAIGYSFRYYATVMNESENIKLLSIEDIEPNIENIKSGAYPFTAEFYIVSTQNISHEGQKLIDWFLSEQGQALIEDIGYVPLKEF